MKQTIPDELYYDFKHFYDQGKTPLCEAYSRSTLLSYVFDTRITPEFLLEEMKEKKKGLSQLLLEGFDVEKITYSCSSKAYNYSNIESVMILLLKSPLIIKVKLFDEVNMNTKKIYLKDSKFTGWKKALSIKGTHNLCLTGFNKTDKKFYLVNSWGRSITQEISFDLFEKIILKIYSYTFIKL